MRWVIQELECLRVTTGLGKDGFMLRHGFNYFTVKSMHQMDVFYPPLGKQPFQVDGYSESEWRVEDFLLSSLAAVALFLSELSKSLRSSQACVYSSGAHL